jgi:uncharacterized protein (TIGR02118 family)
MYCLSVAYPNKDGARFDFDYYTRTHLPMLTGLLGASLVKTEVRKGVASPGGAPPSFICMSNLWLTTPDVLQAALASKGKELMEDVPKFTNVQPVLQIDEVVA